MTPKGNSPIEFSTPVLTTLISTEFNIISLSFVKHCCGEFGNSVLYSALPLALNLFKAFLKFGINRGGPGYLNLVCRDQGYLFSVCERSRIPLVISRIPLVASSGSGEEYGIEYIVYYPGWSGHETFQTWIDRSSTHFFFVWSNGEISRG